MNSRNQNESSEKDGEFWRKSILTPDATILDALKVINQTPIKLALVCERNHFLLGTVSDGDIRRSLLRGIGVSSSLEGVLARNPITVSKDASSSQVRKVMIETQIDTVPIVDDLNRLIGVHTLNFQRVKIPLVNKFVIMAGGMGKRLMPITEKIPKPMVQIGGKPIIEHIILQAKEEGFLNFVITLHHMGEVIRDYLGDGSKYDINIEYVLEDSPLGTAGSLSLLESIPSEPLLITNGDVLTSMLYSSMLDFHHENNSSATMAVHVSEWQNPFGVVEVEGFEIIGYVEKPVTRSLVNSGVYVLEPSSIALLEYAKPCDMPALFQIVKDTGNKTLVYPIHETWIDIGSPEDFRNASSNMNWKLSNPRGRS
jgi:dTDP-glucose pyrophosphorylase